MTLIDPPGPAGIPVLGVLPALSLSAPAFFQHVAARYGDVAMFRIGRVPTYLVSHPDHIQQVFHAEPADHYNKQTFHATLSSAFGESLLTSPGGASWRRKHDLLQPFFTRAAVNRWFPLIRNQIEQQLASWRMTLAASGDFDLPTEINRVIECIMARLLFGEHVNERDTVASMRTINRALYWQLMGQFVCEGRISRWLAGGRQFQQAVRRVEREIERLSEFITTASDNSIFAAIDASAMSRTELRDELFTLYFAGQDTTTASISWLLYRLARHPEYQNLIHDEIGNDLDEKSLCQDNYPKLSRFVAETLRLHPPIYCISRTAQRNDHFGNFRIRAGASVLNPQCYVHRHPKLWHDPECFNPDRFTREQSAGRSRCAYFPFAIGERTCLGVHLAMLEMRTVVAAIVQQFTLRLTSEVAVKPSAGITLRPKTLPVQLIHRSSSKNTK